jgi:hypothetical protein
MKNDIWFFDRYGTPTIILTKNLRFLDRYGNNLGYVYDKNKIYNYQGRHCGWIESMLIRDLQGQTVSFCYISNDSPSPIFPIPQIPPIPHIPKIPPIPRIPQISKIKPIKKFGWSNLLPLELFNQNG